ncbi:MAG: 50S ribosomal protein L23 [Clostridiales bacterium]|nr:50S ribosomal protein L23 [Clostridiales bacterium]
MRVLEDIIRKPYITEKSNMEAVNGKYTFIVDVNATNTEIKQAVEKLFQVKVMKVNTANFRGKVKKQGVYEGPRPSWKKAIVKIDQDPKASSYLTKGGKEVGTGKKYKNTIEEFGLTQ